MKKDVPERFTPYVKLALEKGADHAVVVETGKVFTEPWVRMKCQFGCAGYGKSLCCPPRTPAPDEMRRILDSYSYGLLLHRHWPRDYGLVRDFNDTVVEMERTLFLDGYYKAWGLGMGPCRRCEVCNASAGCVHPQQARPSMEACGIDVYKTARDFDLPIQVVRDKKEERNVFGLVLIE